MMAGETNFQGLPRRVLGSGPGVAHGEHSPPQLSAKAALSRPPAWSGHPAWLMSD